MASSETVFSAVSSSARQICLLLRCIQFTSKAHVTITDTGLHFMAEDSRVMHGSVLLNRNLFSSFVYHPPPTWHNDNDSQGDDDDSPNDAYHFQINLPALLETLQILGISEQSFGRFGARDPLESGITAAMARGGPASAFNNRVLGTAGICRFSYAGSGSPLSIVLEESNVTTTCALTTYEPEAELGGDIPLKRDALVLKIIMKASLLLNAMTELDSTSPTRLTLEVSPSAPNLTLSASGPHASASVEFSEDKQLLETFQCAGIAANSYKFSMIKGASKAMALASKVSIRTDENGVLSLQFMIEGEGSSGDSFVDFRFVALLDEDDEL